MPIDFTNTLVIGISSSSLFDLEAENKIFEEKGLEEYRAYQLEHEDTPPKPGTGFHLAKALLKLNKYGSRAAAPLVEVIVMSRNDSGIGLRIFNAIKTYRLKITRAAFTSGTPLSDYLEPFGVDLFLSKDERDVQSATNAGFASAIIQNPPAGYEPDKKVIRLAFDGDAVIFSDESEKIYQKHGLDAFLKHEEENAKKELPEGPFGKLLKSLAKLQGEFPPNKLPVRLALVAARNAPAHERVLRTLRAWNIKIDESFFLGGLPKEGILKAFRAHIFFEDQPGHLGPASKHVPSAKVPYKN